MEVNKDEEVDNLAYKVKVNKVYLVLDNMNSLNIKTPKGEVLNISFEEQGMFGVCPVFKTIHDANEYVGGREGIMVIPLEINGSTSDGTEDNTGGPSKQDESVKQQTP